MSVGSDECPIRYVTETLRKYPPVPTLNRECSKDYRIPGSHVTIEKGTQVVIPVEALQHDPQYYPEPDKFDPERFSEEAKNRRHHYVYLPFGEGPRLCIGKYCISRYKVTAYLFMYYLSNSFLYS
jgi:cytochrome P450 family 6